MGKDLKGIDRGECRLCKETQDDCEEYILKKDAQITQETACRDCLHPVAVHKERTTPITIDSGEPNSESVKSNIKEDNSWRDKKLGAIAGFETCSDIYDCSTIRTKNQVVRDMHRSKFSKNGWSIKRPLDCNSFKKHYVLPEYKRRIEVKQKLAKLQNKVKFISSENPNALGYFAHPDIVLKATDGDNFTKQLSNHKDIIGEIEDLRKTLREHESENTIEESNGNRRPKRGLEPVIEFDNECNTELINMETKLSELDAKIIPVKRKFDKDFILGVPKNRDKARAERENKRKGKKRKGDKGENIDVSAPKKGVGGEDEPICIEDSDREDEERGQGDSIEGDETFQGDSSGEDEGTKPTDSAQKGPSSSSLNGLPSGGPSITEPTSMIRELLFEVVKKVKKIVKLKDLQKFAYLPDEKEKNT